MSDTRYILFTGSMQPKNPMLATEDKIKEIVGAGFRQGKDFDIVSEKVLKDRLGRREGGMIGYAEGGPTGLYANIHAKRKRIKAGSGEKMRQVGSQGAPTQQSFIDSAKTAKKAGGGMMNMDEMTRPLGYKFGTEDGTLVGDREKDLKEWEKDAIDRLRRKRDIEKLLEKMPEILDEPKTLEEFFKKIPDMEKEEELPDWVKEFLEKRREDPNKFERLLPKREDEGEPFYRPPGFGPYFGPDRFKYDPRYDPRYDRKPFMIPRDKEGNITPFKQPDRKPFMIPRDKEGNRIPFNPEEGIQPLPYYNPVDRYGPGEFGTRPRVNPELGPYIIRPDDPPFDPEKDIELLGDETSGLMEDSSGIKILGMKLQLQKVLSLDMIDKMEDMSPIEIEILYNDTFGKVS